jgi:predicted ATP-grasp superfamily ATP-dependent carboligase
MVSYSTEVKESPQQAGRLRRAVEKCDVLVLDARLRQSLVTVRSLGSRGLHVAALDSISSVPAFSSRWCHKQFVCQGDEATEEYLTSLEQALDRCGAHVLIPSADSTVALIRLHRERLEQRVHLALAREPGLGIAVNKKQTLDIAGQLGLGVPRGVLVKTESDVDAAVREIGLPLVIKPVESWLWGEHSGSRVASHLITTLDEARRVVEQSAMSGGSMLFQQFLTGRREAVNLFYANGAIYARFAQWAKRTDPPLGGTSVLRQSIPVPQDIGEQAERLVRAIELEGYAEVEFRRDSKGVPYLMEINPRLSASVEIALRSGVDFPLLLYQWAGGEPIDKVQDYRTGLWMRYLRGDLMTTIAALQQRGRPGIAHPVRAVFDFCISCVVPMTYDYVDWKDPTPSIVATTDFMRQWIGNAVSKRLSHVR